MCEQSHKRNYMSCLITAELQLQNLSPTVKFTLSKKGSILQNNENVIKTYIGLPSLPCRRH